MAEKKVFRTTVYLGTVNGKPKTKSVYAKSQKELDRKVADLKREVQDGKNAYDKATFGVWADKWYKENKEHSGITDGSKSQIVGAVNQLKSAFKETELRKIHLSDFQQFINDFAKENPKTHKPTARRTLNGYKAIAEDIFGYAEANGIVGVSTTFFKFVSIPKNAPKKDRRALTEEEQQRIIEMPHRCQLPAMLMMFSGLRRGEALALEWTDIDLEKGIISVSKSLDKVSGEVKQGGKTKNSTRYVAIPRILVKYLKDYKASAKVLSRTVCTNIAGQRYTANQFKEAWESYLTDMNVKYGYAGQNVSKFDPHGLPFLIEKFTPHYLRHTYATILFLLGVDVVTAKQYLGHADIQTTINIYTDLERFYKFNLSDTMKKKLEDEYKLLIA